MVHLQEKQRYSQDQSLKTHCQTVQRAHSHLGMNTPTHMGAIALGIRPDTQTLVPDGAHHLALNYNGALYERAMHVDRSLSKIHQTQT